MKASDMEKFKEPFPSKDIDWRLQSCGEKNGKFWGKALAYITSRAVQERLDSVCGPDGWKLNIRKETVILSNPKENSKPLYGDAYFAELSIRVEHEDGTAEWITRVDGADATDIEPVKGGISGAVKRAAVLFGIGRYLYNLTESWAEISDSGKYSGRTKEGKFFKWNPPKLPSWALPADEKDPVQKELTEEPAFDEETERLKKSLQEWIDTGILKGDFLKKAEWYMEKGNIKGMKDTINWCKEQRVEAV